MNTPRFFQSTPLAAGHDIELADGAARHVQVLRLQPGRSITLFDGTGGEFLATVTHMGKRDVRVLVGERMALEREANRQVHLLVGLMANERMDWLVEKATELGAASITPVLAERTVLRLSGERAEKKRTHWQSIATAACEQCGRNRVPAIAPLQSLAQAIFQAIASAPVGQRLLLSLAAHATGLAAPIQSAAPVTLLCGPEGGLSPAEEAAAAAAGFAPTSLGSRVLRAETAPLAALAVFTAIF